MPVPSQGHSFTVFRLLTDFVCLYNYEFLLSLCKIARNSIILLLPLLSVIRTKFQVCKLQLKHMKLTWQTLEWSWARFKIFIVRIITKITALFSNIYWEIVRITNNCVLQCMCIISKQIVLYGSDVQLYNEKAFQNNIKSII